MMMIRIILSIMMLSVMTMLLMLMMMIMMMIMMMMLCCPGPTVFAPISDLFLAVLSQTVILALR